MKKKITLLSAVLVLMLAGCGAKETATGNYAAREEAYGAAEMNDSAAMGEYDATEEMKDASNEDTSEEGVTGQKLVYTGNLRIQTLNYDESIQTVRDKIKEFKGIIEDQNEYDNDYSWYTSSANTSKRTMSLTVRIPSASFDDFMSSLDGTGKVISRSSNVENITRRYNDNETRISSLQIQLDRLLEMMKQAETIDEMIAVESRLTEVEYELNRLKTYRSSMDTDVEYSTITLSIEEVKVYKDEKQGFGDSVVEAIQESWEEFVWFLEDFVIWFIHAFPFIILLIVLVVVFRKFIWNGLKTLFNKIFRRKKKTEVKEVKDEEKLM